jgi:serine/threonine protein phosphatase 1
MEQNTQRTFAIGDIHGGYRALVKALQLAKFDYDNDKLIALGDVCDGWSETPEAIEELLKIKNLVYIKGNHDSWAYKGLTKESGFMHFNGEGQSWLHHGGQATQDAYVRRADLKEKHLEFLKNALPFYLDEKNRLFVHAGIRPGTPVQNTPESVLIWDRNFWYSMYAGKNVGKDYTEVYIGHTPTLNFPDNKGNQYKPMNRQNTWNLDTGAAFYGSLTIMNIDTKEYWQTERVRELYVFEKGRNDKAFVNDQK